MGDFFTFPPYFILKLLSRFDCLKNGNDWGRKENSLGGREYEILLDSQNLSKHESSFKKKENPQTSEVTVRQARHSILKLYRDFRNQAKFRVFEIDKIIKLMYWVSCFSMLSGGVLKNHEAALQPSNEHLQRDWQGIKNTRVIKEADFRFIETQLLKFTIVYSGSFPISRKERI